VASAAREFGEARADRLPATEEEWRKFDVIILGDIPDGALSEADVREKFMSNAQRAIDAAQAEEVWQAVMDLDQSPDLSALTSVLGAQGD